MNLETTAAYLIMLMLLLAALADPILFLLSSR
jgi:hypothetical protein